MALEIGRNGIVFRDKDGKISIIRPDRNGGPGVEIAVNPELAEEYRLATGDIVEGETAPIAAEFFDMDDSDAMDPQSELDVEIDEPAAVRGISISRSLPTRRPAAEELVRLSRINGVAMDAAEERPFPRTKRSSSERTPPDTWLTLADGPADYTGRLLDFAAPLGTGVFGVIFGPHGAGLSRTLQAALNGIVKNRPACVPLVLLLRPRAEEATEWRRRLPGVEVVVASSAFGGGTPDQTLQLCELMLEAAQRQTEMGHDVVLIVDSLTALWGTMLEAEEADAQHEADTSAARQRMREWTQKAGCFHGETPLGGGLGGSLTILGSVWHQAIDEEAEEERDTHPHLRLLEHVLPESAWLVALSEVLKRRRLFPAIDIKRCRSNYEEKLLPAGLVEPLLTVRGSLPRGKPVDCYNRLMDAMEATGDMLSLLDWLAAAPDL